MDTLIQLEVSGADAEWLETEVRRVWGRCLLDLGVHKPDVRIPVVLDDESDRARTMDALSPRVTLAAVEHQAGSLMMLHACALAEPGTGRSVVMVGPSGMGKTTISRTLGARYGYITDEAVAIRQDGSVAAYPKPLSLIVDGLPFKQQAAVDDLGATPEVCQVSRILVLERDGTEEPRLAQVTTVRALAMLASQTSYLSRLPRPLHRLADIVEGAGGLSVLHYADASHLFPVLDECLDAP